MSKTNVIHSTNALTIKEDTDISVANQGNFNDLWSVFQPSYHGSNQGPNMLIKVGHRNSHTEIIKLFCYLVLDYAYLQQNTLIKKKITSYSQYLLKNRIN